MISRKKAKQKQLKTYFTGKPCKRGHISKRRTDNTGCVECGKLLSRHYRDQNPEQIQRATKKYYKQHRKRALKYAKLWQFKNKHHKDEYNKQYYEQHKEHLKKYARQYRRQNPDKHAYYNERRYRYLKDATPSWADKEAIKFFYECRPIECHVDHVIPIIHPLVCGLHVETNLQWLPAKMNLSKKNTFG